MPFGTPFGRPEEWLTYAACEPIKGGKGSYELNWSVAPDCDGYCQIALDGAKIGAPVHSLAGSQARKLLTIPNGNRLVSIVSQGQFADRAVRIQDEIDYFRTQPGRGTNSVQANIAVVLDMIIEGGGGQLSNLVLNGIRRGNNIAAVDGKRNWGQYALTLTTAGGVHTVTLWVNGRDMVRGSITGSGTIPLSGGGVFGSIDLAYSADITAGANVYVRWPQQLRIYLKNGPFLTGDFPRHPTAAIADDGVSNNFIFKSFPLPGFVWYAVVHQVGDDGNESTDLQSGGLPLTTVDIPYEPTGLAYVSGGYAATVITFIAAETGADSYNIYDTLDTGLLNLLTPAANVASAGNHALGAIGSGFTGTRYVWARTVKGGVEEANLNFLAINYAAGVRVALRPPPPVAGVHAANAARLLTVPVSVFLDPSFAVPATLELYAYLSGAAVDYTSPLAVLALPANPAGTTTLTVSIAGTVAVNGLYYFQVRTKTAGGLSSNNAQEYGPVELTTAAMAGPNFIVLAST